MANEFKVKNGLIVIGDLTTSGTITINGALAATQSWVTSQAYLTSASLSGYATQSYVTSAIAALVDSAPAALDTLNELAAALGDDANFSTTITNSIAAKLPLAGGTLTGTLNGTSATFSGNVTLGNAADLVFVDLAGIYPTSGKGFDWTLNNDGARIYAIQPSSDSIDLVFKLRDNATTNDRFVFWVDEWQGPAYDKYPLIISGGTQFDLKDSSLYTNTVLRLSNSGVLQNVTGNISMFTNNVGYLTSYTETDTLASVTGRGASTSTNISVNSVSIGTDATYGGAYRSVSFGYNGDGSNRIFAANDSSDGMYFTAATGQGFNFRPNGGTANLVVINSSGNVGIGTNSPSAKLHVNGTFISNALWTDGTSIGYWGAYPTAYGGLTWDTGQATVYATSGNKLYLASNGSSPDMTIDTSGNVGIGTTSPAVKLHVSAGNAIIENATSSFLRVGETSTGNSNRAVLVADSTGMNLVADYGTSAIPMLFKTSNAERMRITSGGNVGIGTTSANRRLTVFDTANNYQLRIGYSDSYYYDLGRNSSDGYFDFYGNQTGYTGYRFGGVDGTRLAITPSGNVGIGTTSPSFKTTISADITKSGDINPGTAQLSLEGSTTPGKRMILGYDINSNGFGFIKSGNYGVTWTPLALQPDGGNVGIGTVSPSTKLDVSGVITATGGNSTNWNTAYGWGNHSGLYAPLVHTHSAADITSGTLASARLSGSYAIDISGASSTSNTLTREDNRTISPSELAAGQLKFGFTSWANNNTSPYADFLHLRSYTDASGGTDNLVMFKKSGMGMRIWQQTWGSTTAYSSYVDVWTTGDFSSTSVSNWNTAYGWGNHASAGYATTSYVTTQINNLIAGAPGALDTLDELAAALGDDSNFATTVTNSIAGKVSKSGDTMTGSLTIQNGPSASWDYMTLEHPGPHARINLGNAENGFLIAHEGTTTATFATNGNLTITGALIETSSIKVKENVETSEGNLEKVVNLRPVTYNKIGSQTTELGLIAEEVAEVYPEFVQYDENGDPIGVHYSRLTAALIGAVKELTNQVQELNKKING